MSLLESNTTYKPFKYPWAVEYAVNHERIHWIEDELELQTDVNHWKSDALTQAEKNHITQILRLFTQTDVAVGTNYLEYYIPKFKNNEIRAMLTAFASREFIHQRAYALLNDCFDVIMDLHEEVVRLETHNNRLLDVIYQNQSELESIDEPTGE